MKQITLLSILSLIFWSCENEEVTVSNPSLDGAVFNRTSYVIETAVDGNGDGNFSFDLMQENFCTELSLTFNDETGVPVPSNDVFTLDIAINGTEDLVQLLNCSHFDGPYMQYELKNNIIEFYYSEDLNYTGILSEDGNTITINLDNRFLTAFNFFNPKNKILNEDGTVTEYAGDAVLTYTRQ